MKLKHLKPAEDIELEVVNQQPTAAERQEISSFIRQYKMKAKRSATRSTQPAK